MRAPSSGCKNQGNNSPLKSSVPANTSILIQREPFRASDLQNDKIINWGYFRPLQLVVGNLLQKQEETIFFLHIILAILS